MKYHLLPLLFFRHSHRTRCSHEGYMLRRWRIKFWSTILYGSPHIEIVHRRLRSGPRRRRLLILFHNVGNGINVKHYAERFWFTILHYGIRRKGASGFVLRLCYDRFAVTQRLRIYGIVISAVSMYSARRESKKV